MVTTIKECEVVQELIKALDENIADCGRCDHSVGICICHLIELRRTAEWLQQYNGWIVKKPQRRTTKGDPCIS